MELSHRYVYNVKEAPWGFVVAFFTTAMILMFETQRVLPTLFQSITNELMVLPIGILLIMELFAIFFASGFIITFLYTCIQQLFFTKWHEAPRPFLLNNLAYRLFYAKASRINLLVFGFFIGFYLQTQVLLGITDDISDWRIIGNIVFPILQGFVIQFFAQCLLISLHYVGSHLLRSKTYRMFHPRKIKVHFLHLKRHALEPINLILSFVVVPAILLLYLLVSHYFGQHYTFNEMTLMITLFSCIVYGEVTFILHFTAHHKRKKKTKA